MATLPAPAPHPVRPPPATARPAGTFPAFSPLAREVCEHLDDWLSAARLEVVSAVEWECTPEWLIQPRRIEDNMWFLLAEGRGSRAPGLTLACGGVPIRACSGDLLLIPKGRLHALAPDPGVSWRLVAIHFHAEIYQGVNLLELLNFPLHYPADPDAPYRAASQTLAREFALRQPGWRRAASAELLRVLTHLIRAHGNRLRVAGPGGGPAQLPRLAPALRFVDAHLDEPGIPVSLLAERLHLSEVRFRKIFKQVLGLPPVRFIQRRRVERACALLRATDLTVDQIAYRCGFTDSPFFCRVFRQWMKTTPARYRNEGRI